MKRSEAVRSMRTKSQPKNAVTATSASDAGLLPVEAAVTAAMAWLSP